MSGVLVHGCSRGCVVCTRVRVCVCILLQGATEAGLMRLAAGLLWCCRLHVSCVNANRYVE